MRPTLCWLAAAAAAVVLCLIPLHSQPEPPVESNGIAVTPGSGWQLNRTVLDAGGPIALTNFGGAWLRGGILPPGGAEIDLTSQPVPAGTPWTQVAAAELAGARFGPAQETTVGGSPAIRFTYQDTYTPTLEYETVAYNVNRGQTLYKFFLTYHTGDPGAARFAADFDRMVAGVRFTR